MKLAEAMVRCDDCEQRLQELRQRLEAAALVQEGDQPAEHPDALLTEAEEVADEVVVWRQRIGRTRATSRLSNGTALIDALAVCEALARKHALYRDLALLAAAPQQRLSRAEVRFVRTVDVAKLQRQADLYAKQHRDLEVAIQEANWGVDLAD